VKARYYVLTLTVVALLIGGAWTLAMAAESAATAPAKAAVKAEPAKGKTVVVKITDKGFEPEKADLTMGDTIEFKNETKAAVTVTDDRTASKAQTRGIARKPRTEEAFKLTIEPGKSATHEFKEPFNYYKFFIVEDEKLTGTATVKNEKGELPVESTGGGRGGRGGAGGGRRGGAGTGAAE
jgi:plastocyanin